MSRGELLVWVIVGGVAVACLTALFVAVLRDKGDYSNWGREHNDR